MAMYDKLPADPVMLLSFLNTQLRDNYASFEELAAALGLDREATLQKLAAIHYSYDAASNRFV